MFLEATLRRNPDLIRAAARLHQEGEIPPNTFVIDLDALAGNAAALTRAADQNGIFLYQMTKQHGRNPVAARATAAGGIRAAVCVDLAEARALAYYGITIGHVGHLQQIPDRCLAEALSYQPEVVTCFSVDKALHLGKEAARLGREQQLLFRVRANDPQADDFYHAQEGGVRLADLEEAVRSVSGVAGLRLVGATTFPIFVVDEDRGEATATRNVQTLLQAAETMRRCGVDLVQVNGPGLTCCATLPEAARRGITHAEPGSALIGNTPLHALRDQAEVPAMCYVSEVSHVAEGTAMTFGGGYYPRSRMRAALVATESDPLMECRYPTSSYPAEAIDYYGKLVIPDGLPMPNVGDTVIYAFRSQVFVSRSMVAPVIGLSRGNPRLAGLWNALGHPVDRQGRPLSREDGEAFIALAGF